MEIISVFDDAKNKRELKQLLLEKKRKKEKENEFKKNRTIYKYMNILTSNSIITTTFTTMIGEINVKYKKERGELKKVIAETARSQAQQILTNESDDMGNPEELCNKLAELQLKYNAIVVKQKQETDSTMNKYKNEITTNMVAIK
tara:strand:- start:655 stop:1089 length:435 start_codon:yes stop_codon:yes gene_type:complete